MLAVFDSSRFYCSMHNLLKQQQLFHVLLILHGYISLSLSLSLSPWYDWELKTNRFYFTLFYLLAINFVTLATQTRPRAEEEVTSLKKCAHFFSLYRLIEHKEEYFSVVFIKKLRIAFEK